MLVIYLEETEDLLQKAEDCLIRLEREYSADAVNEIFRIAHTIKGSSYMVGYKEIGSVTHKVEDMLDCIRNGRIPFKQNVVSLCFEGFDTVKKMLQRQKGSDPGTDHTALFNSAVLQLKERINRFITTNRPETEVALQPTRNSKQGIVASLLDKERRGNHQFFVRFMIAADAPMLSPVQMMVLTTIDSIGSLSYSSITDEALYHAEPDAESRIGEMIVNTALDEGELHACLDLFYIERIDIVNLSARMSAGDGLANLATGQAVFERFFDGHLLLRQLFNSHSNLSDEDQKLGPAWIEEWRLEVNEVFREITSKNRGVQNLVKEFNDFYELLLYLTDGRLIRDKKAEIIIRTQYRKLLERAYLYVRGKVIYRIFKAENTAFLPRFKDYIERVNMSSTRWIWLDLSQIAIVDEHNLKELIEVKERLETQGVQIGIIAGGVYQRRIVNIFDSIKTLVEFKVFHTELDAVLGREA